MLEDIRRGFIYEFDTGKYEPRYVLAVSSNSRSKDKLVSVIMFGNHGGGHDVVHVNNKCLGDMKYLHCALVTYTNREYLVREIGQVSADVMSKVDSKLCKELSIFEDGNAELEFYKTVYYDLLDRCMKLCVNGD